MKFKEPHFGVIGSAICMVLSMLCFSFIGAFSRWSGEQPLLVAFWRATLTALLIGGWVLLKKDGLANIKIVASEWKVIVPYGVSIGVTMITYISAFMLTTFSNTMVLHYLMPAVVLVAGIPLLGERPTWCQVWGMVISFVGVAVIFGKDISEEVSSRQMLGNLAAIASAVGYTGLVLFTRKARVNGIPIIKFMFWGWVIGALFCLPWVAVYEDKVIPDVGAWWSLGSLAVFATVLPTLLFNISFKGLKANVGSVISFSEVVFAILVGWMFFCEKVSILILACSVLVFGGIVLALKKTKRESEDATGGH